MEVELTTLVVIGTDCTGSCKSNYHTITSVALFGVSFTLSGDTLTSNDIQFGVMSEFIFLTDQSVTSLTNTIFFLILIKLGSIEIVFKDTSM